ncbi:MAG TPA: ParB/RepB/Spo0J family partition protein [Bacteroidia bacterium]|jgi:ParB family chromosome partitioning protein
MSTPNKRNALGKGLSALLENADTDITSNKKAETAVAGSVSNIPVSQIVANPFQPRTDFEAQSLLDLANSIKEQGIIQPVTVRKMGYDQYQLISGERRFRASQMAGLSTIPAYIRIANDQAMLEMALVENIQRENLNAIEVALSYKRLIDECNLTQEELSKKVGKERSTIANFLRLLKLPAEIQAGIRDGKISMGHARALLSLESEAKQVAVFKQIVDDSLSVREVENLSRNIHTYKNKLGKAEGEKSVSSLELDTLAENLKEHFKAKVKVQKSVNGSGKITIPFRSEEDLGRILNILEL